MHGKALDPREYGIPSLRALLSLAFSGDQSPAAARERPPGSPGPARLLEDLSWEARAALLRRRVSNVVFAPASCREQTLRASREMRSCHLVQIRSYDVQDVSSRSFIRAPSIECTTDLRTCISVSSNSAFRRLCLWRSAYFFNYNILYLHHDQVVASKEQEVVVISRELKRYQGELARLR